MLSNGSTVILYLISLVGVIVVLLLGGPASLFAFGISTIVTIGLAIAALRTFLQKQPGTVLLTAGLVWAVTMLAVGVIATFNFTNVIVGLVILWAIANLRNSMRP